LNRSDAIDGSDSLTISAALAIAALLFVNLASQTVMVDIERGLGVRPLNFTGVQSRV
jgi:hypothetical protein